MERSSLLNQLCLIVLVLAPLCAFPAQAPEQAVANDRIIYWESDADDLRMTAIKPTDKKPHRLTARISPKQLQTDIPVLLSPDGKWAAYPSTRLAGDDSPDEGIVHIRPLDQPEPKGRSLEAKGAPICWSPDGKQLIVADLNQTPVSHTVIDVASGTRTPLSIPAIKTPKDNRDSYSYFVTDWSPDGKSWLVVYFELRERPGVEESYLYLTKSDGTVPVHLEHLDMPFTARFSPDGKRILYLSGKEVNQLFVADVQPSKPVRVSPINGRVGEFDFCWSPDGKRIAYCWSNEQDGADAETALIVANADGSNEQVLTAVKGDERMMGSPNWR